MEYEVLSPWAQVNDLSSGDFQPRIDNINGRVIGLYSHFKEHAPLIQKEIEFQLKGKFPEAKFSHYQYPVDTFEIINDSVHKPVFEEWLSGVDAVVCAYGDAGSCSMYLAYNAAAIEHLGKPVVLLADRNYTNPARRGASARQVPNLRIIQMDISDLSAMDSLDNAIESTIRPAITSVLDELVDAITKPLTEDEKQRPVRIKDTSRIIYRGNIGDVNNYFYTNGWTNGIPLVPPTEKAVAEMLSGTDLPPDYVVAKLPPMLGNATAEKIAVNAVMAGCLPTYMPILIAAVQGMADPVIRLEGWTCSAASWAPMIIINGPVSRDLNVHSGAALMSPYSKANATIARALGLIIMNLSGVRPGLEDASVIGHEARFGMCIAENEEMSPWEPLHTDYGLNKDDSSVTLFWPSERSGWKRLGCTDADGILSALCESDTIGFNPGCMFLLTPVSAKILSDEGWTRKDVISYVVEYARRPASEVNIRWIKGNNHLPKEVALPVNPVHPTRKFFSSEHLFIVVAGGNVEMHVAYGGGGDHGGPVNKKVELPADWENLVGRYKDIVPNYIQY